MQYKSLHKWKVAAKKAVNIQRVLAEKISSTNKRLTKIEKIAGVDVSFGNGKCCAAVCVFSYPELLLLEQKTAITKVTFPYIPTLLTFREGPAILNCFKKVKNRPDVILFDGQGIAHPRRMGLATHIGLWLKLPTIGCAKTPLYGKFSLPPGQKGRYSFIKEGKTSIGAVVRTKDNTNPIFVSQGYRITLKQAIKISLKACTKYRIPQALRAAHILSKSTIAAKLKSIRYS